MTLSTLALLVYSRYHFQSSVSHSVALSHYSPVAESTTVSMEAMGSKIVINKSLAL